MIYQCVVTICLASIAASALVISWRLTQLVAILQSRK